MCTYCRITLVLVALAGAAAAFLAGCDSRVWLAMLNDPNNPAPQPTAQSAEAPRPASSPADQTPTPQRETAMFGAGCFWGVEATFRKVPGVLDTAVGYSGGHVERPTYKQVCTDRTGHAEVVRVEYDPSQVTYQQLLNIFWQGHNPTQLNRQGPDVGTQYRSVIFYFNEEQRRLAEQSKERLERSNRFRRPVVTQIVPAGPFWRAEEYHQRYLEKRGVDQCHL
jgi:peptide-methionine (S)-S-oxide reductase